MKFSRYIIGLVAFLLLLPMAAQGKSYYNSANNSFGGLFPHPGMHMAGRYKAIEDNLLIEENASMGIIVTTDTMAINSPTYRYQLRLANLNNKIGKTRSIKNPMTGEKITLSVTQWGLVFNRDDDGNYCAVLLGCDNSAAFDDITDQRKMQISLIQRQGRSTKELVTATLNRGVSLEDEMNTLCVEVSEHSVRVMIGKDELQQVIETAVDRPAGPVWAGYYVGPGARIAIERAVLTVDNNNQVNTATSWTRKSLDEHFAQSIDPNEGYWKYLDRDIQDEWLRLGGRYTLAVVKNNNNGYDLIYMQGAQVKKSMWQPGMLKGTLSKTAFSDNYDAVWIDATLEPIDKDVYATFENGVIMTVYFPVFQSQLRLAKVLDIED